MTISAIEAAALLVVFLAVALLSLVITGWRPLPRRPAVLIVLKSGETVRGVLISRRPTVLELGAAELLHRDTPAQAIDGRVYIDRANVAWVQAPEV